MTQQKLNYLQRKQLNQIKYLKEQIEARKTMVESAYIRKMILEKQKINNYQSEYNRLRAHLEESAIPFETKQHIKERTDHLKKLGATAFEIV